MSSATPASESSRRRRPTNKSSTKPSSDPTPVDASEKKPRPPRVETIAIPESYVGKSFTGRISDVIRVGFPKPRPSFGFINIGTNVEPIESVPRIYFKRGDYSDPEEKHYLPRKGYEVEFVVNKSEEGRFFATNVKLTAAGRAEADINKAKADEAKAAKLAAEPAVTTGSSKEAKTTESVPRTRSSRPRNETVVKLKVTLEGKEGSNLVDVKIARPLGSLKRDVIKLFGAEGDYTINHMTPTGPVFLTVAILKSLKDGDALHFSKKLTE